MSGNPSGRLIQVHLLPEFIPPGSLEGGLAVVIDVLRATTTMVHALAAGCPRIIPCLDVQDARNLASTFPGGRVILAGERNAQKIAEFDLGNSPGDFTPDRCRDSILVMTTTNGTRALLQAAGASRVFIGAFTNFSAVGEQLQLATCPVHLICAGQSGVVALEDVLLAGGLVEYLDSGDSCVLNDSARLAKSAFRQDAPNLEHALASSNGGVGLKALGYDEDVRIAARIDRYHLVPELKLNPTRIEVGTVGSGRSHWAELF